jgi:hypothetical protein
MRFPLVYVCLLVVSAAAAAQNPPNSAPALQPVSVTIPFTLDHNRAIINVQIPLPDRTVKDVGGWVDNGNPDLRMSQRVAGWLGLTVSCDVQFCTAAPNPPAAPLAIVVGGMRISLPAASEIKIRAGAPTIAPGLNAEINIPSTALRNYDVLIDYPDREFTIAKPGGIRFKGSGTKVQIDPSNGIIEVPSQIERKKYNLMLDLGSSFSLLSKELFENLASTHSDWPQMTGAIGPANLWGTQDEATWKLMRLDRVQFGSLHLIDLAMAEFPEDKAAAFKQRTGTSAAGLLGADALLNYRVGLDYAHSLVYFDIGRMFQFPEFDVVGLILRPEDDGNFTIIGIANFEGKPSVPEVQAGDHLTAVDGIPVLNSTMGQAWSMLQGSPGQERKLTIERGGKQFTVLANVRHFLAVVPDQEPKKGK